MSEEQALLLIRRVLADHGLPGMTRVVIGRGHATRASQPVEAVLVDVGVDRRDLGNLVPRRVGVVPLEGGTTAPLNPPARPRRSL